MELSINLLAQRRSNLLQLVFGILFLIVATGFFFSRYYENGTLTLIDIMLFSLLLFNGVLNVFAYFGIHPAMLYGRAYVKINWNIVSIKQGLFEKAQIVRWDKVKSISTTRTGALKVFFSNGNEMVLNMSKLQFAIIQEIKNTVSVIAALKGISVDIK